MGRLSTTRKFIRNFLLLVVLALVVLLWLARNPQHLLPLARRLLPEGIQIERIDGIHIDLRGGRLAGGDLIWEGNRIQLYDTRWRWIIAPVWPVQPQINRIQVKNVSVRLAATVQSDKPLRWPDLSPLTDTRLWPVLNSLDLELKTVRVERNSGKLLAQGKLSALPGLSRGALELTAGDEQRVSLNWQKARNRADWIVDWQAWIPGLVSGTLRLYPQNKALTLKFAADSDALEVGERLVEKPHFEMNAKAYPFGDANALLEGNFTVSSQIRDTNLKPISISCTGETSANKDFSASLRTGPCRFETEGVSARVQAPFVVRFSTPWKFESVRTEGGSIDLVISSISDWRFETLGLSIPPGTIWTSADKELTVPAASFRGRFANPALALNATVSATAEISRLTPDAQWENIVNGEAMIEFRNCKVDSLRFQFQGQGTPDEAQFKGFIDHEQIGKLLTADASADLAAGVYRSTLHLDTNPWTWKDDLFQALLGKGQDLIPASLSKASVSLNASLTYSEGHLRGELTGSADDLYGVGGGAAFAGLSTAPFHTRIDGFSIPAPLRLDWRLDHVNTGVELDNLTGTLVRDQDRWHIENVDGELLGGRFTIDSLADFSQDGHQGDVTFRDIDLARIAMKLDIPELTVTGRVKGRIPLFLDHDTVVVPHGTVNSQVEGVIKYQSKLQSGVESPQLDMTRRALSNLQYEALDAQISYHADGNLIIDAKLKGRNPDFDNGRPIHLNLNIENNILSLLKSLRASHRIEEWLERQLATGSK